MFAIKLKYNNAKSNLIAYFLFLFLLRLDKISFKNLFSPNLVQYMEMQLCCLARLKFSWLFILRIFPKIKLEISNQPSIKFIDIFTGLIRVFSQQTLLFYYHSYLLISFFLKHCVLLDPPVDESTSAICRERFLGVLSELSHFSQHSQGMKSHSKSLFLPYTRVTS